MNRANKVGRDHGHCWLDADGTPRWNQCQWVESQASFLSWGALTNTFSLNSFRRASHAWGHWGWKAKWKMGRWRSDAKDSFPLLWLWRSSIHKQPDGCTMSDKLMLNGAGWQTAPTQGGWGGGFMGVFRALPNPGDCFGGKKEKKRAEVPLAGPPLPPPPYHFSRIFTTTDIANKNSQAWPSFSIIFPQHPPRSLPASTP